MRSTPNITEAEWEVMELLWETHPLSAADVAQALGPRRNWSDGTVKTLLARLLKKGALKHEIDGKRYLYSPRASRRRGISRSSSGGLVAPGGGGGAGSRSAGAAKAGLSAG